MAFYLNLSLANETIYKPYLVYSFCFHNFLNYGSIMTSWILCPDTHPFHKISVWSLLFHDAGIALNFLKPLWNALDTKNECIFIPFVLRLKRKWLMDKQDGIVKDSVPSRLLSRDRRPAILISIMAQALVNRTDRSICTVFSMPLIHYFYIYLNKKNKMLES